MSQRTPPLNALKAFEVAARHGSFVAAGVELGVSSAAVSQQVAKLERFFGKLLFARHNNRISLTDAGQIIYAETAASLQTLTDLTYRLREGGVRSRLTISVLASLAGKWLPSRLGRFMNGEELIRLDIRVESDPVDFARHGIDLRICYGTRLYPDLVAAPLFQDHVLPLCTPGFRDRYLARAPEPAELRDEHLIHTNWGTAFASYPSWQEWFAEAGLARVPDAARGHRVDLASTAIDMALSGQAVCLGHRELAHAEIAAGLLVEPIPIAMPMRDRYCAVHPHAKADKAGLPQLLAALRGAPEPE